MADPLISLDTEHAAVQPGGQVRVTVTVTNTGNLVEGFWLQVLGPAAAWAEVVPPEISVYPQQDATAAVILSPPSDGSALSGLLPFGVLASSTLDANTSAAAEGDLEIGELHSLQAKIIPVTSTGRWRGRHVIQLSNWGNSQAQLQMVARDPDDALGFYVSPSYVDLPPGGQATVRLSARTKRPFLRGTAVRIPFQVIGEPLDGGTQPPPAVPYGDPSRPVIDAALNQKPILSRGLLTLLVLLVAGVVALVAFALTRTETAVPDLYPRGAPPKGVLRVVAVTPTSVSLAWDAVALAERYDLQQIDPATKNVIKNDPLDAALTGTDVVGLPSAKEVCFRLTVTRAKITGPPSDPVCATTAAAPPTPVPTPTPTDPATTAAPSPTPTPTPTTSTSGSTPSPTPTFSPGDPNTDEIMKQKWIAVAAVQPKSVAESDVQLHAQQLTGATLPVKYLDSVHYPRMVLYSTTPPPVSTPTPEGSWMVFVGPFPSQPDADAECSGIIAAGGSATCFAAQPDPP
ncbi:MAG TPA: fibronectin type III domain-containing protein [Microlunatus sp.]|nr:fibronectin type III domain-containing protein [Microlunatus sp.]